MSESRNTRRAVVEIPTGAGRSEIPMIGSRSIHQCWQLLAPHFRDVLLAPQRRSDDRGVTWSWQEAAASAPPTPAELVAVRRELTEANRRFQEETDAPEEGSAGGLGARGNLEELRKKMKKLVSALTAKSDARLSGFICRTGARPMIHSWGASTPAKPFYPDAVECEVRGTVFVGEKDAAGFDVVIENRKGACVARTKSDAAGGFQFSKVAPGSYKVRVISGRLDFPVSGVEVMVEHESIQGLKLLSTSLNIASQRGGATGGFGAEAAMETRTPVRRVSREAGSSPNQRRNRAAVIAVAALALAAIGWWVWRAGDDPGLSAQRVASFATRAGGAGTAGGTGAGAPSSLIATEGRASAQGDGAPASPWALTAGPSSVRPGASTVDAPRREGARIASGKGPPSGGAAVLPADRPRPVEPIARATSRRTGSSPPPGSGAAAAATAFAEPDFGADENGADESAPETGDELPPAKDPAENVGRGRRVTKPRTIGGADAAAGGESSPGVAGGEDATARGAEGEGAPASPGKSQPATVAPGARAGKSLVPAPKEMVLGGSAPLVEPADQSTAPVAEAAARGGGKPKRTAGPVRSTPPEAGGGSNYPVNEEAVSADGTTDGAEAVQPAAAPGPAAKSAKRKPPAKRPDSGRPSTPAEPALPGDGTENDPAPVPGATASAGSPARGPETAKSAAGRPTPTEEPPVSNVSAGAVANPPTGAEGAVAAQGPAAKPAAAKARPRGSLAPQPSLEVEPAENAGAPAPGLAPEPDGLVRLVRVRSSAWRSRLVQDIILPTEPVRGDADGSVDGLRARVLEERRKLMPLTVEKPVVRRGFSLALPDTGTGSGGPARWEGSDGAEPAGTTVSGTRAECELPDDRLPAMARLSLRATDGREVARVARQPDGGWLLETSEAVRSSYWITVERAPGDDPGAGPQPRFGWRLLPDQPVPEEWRRNGEGQAGTEYRIDLPVNARAGLNSRFALAFTDRQTGWAIVGGTELKGATANEAGQAGHR